MPKTWDQVKQILALALEQSPEERTGFVRKACGDDAAVRAEVESLLLHYAGADSLLENSPATEALSFSPVMVGKRIGAYRIVREIGRGGMAVVYLGERDDQNYRKRVAIKMVVPGTGTAQILQRFRNERQTLAALDHPNIVKLLDGGSTEDGSPYLVMEYVEGLPIDQYCDQKQLTIDDRLRLFRVVCAAVQYAHQNLVIHRDLKPGNILITGDGLPRLLDFGIAKLLNPECFQSPLTTQANWHPMTPGYASPEQVRGDAVTSATDVYSLGVLLYEILTGCLPYKGVADNWRKIERQICEEEPVQPSTRVSTDQEHLTATAGTRRAEPQQLVRLLRGDLDWITLKALEKEPVRRYAIPSELSADIGRHLSHEAVLARPTSVVYRTQKYVRRHPLGVAVAAGLVLLLAGFAVNQSIQLRRITRERDRANRVTDFMEGMFKVSDPGEARGNSITAREILDKASNDIDKGLAQDPELQAQMMYVMGNVYKELGLFPRAQSLFQRSAEIRRSVLGAENLETLRSLDDLGWILNQQGHAAEAEKLQRETVATRKRVFGERNLDTLKSMSNLAWTLDREGNYAEAEKSEREVLETRRLIGKTEDKETLAAMNNLAATLGHEGHYAQAESLKRTTLEVRQRVFGPDHPDTLLAMNNLGATLQQEGRYAEAEKLQRETLSLQRRILGPEHPDTLRSMNNLANSLFHENQFAEAVSLQREALAIKQRVLGPQHQDTLWAMKELAVTLGGQGQYSQAENLLRQTLEIQRRVLGPERPNTLSTMSNLADTLNKERRYGDAEGLQRQTIEIMQRVLGAEHPFTLVTTDELAETLDREGRYDAAEKLARDTLATQRRVLGPEHPDTASTTYDLGCILAHNGHNDEAFALLREAIGHGLDRTTVRAIATTPDLKQLHKDTRFRALAAYALQRAATGKFN
ncbi:MAG TPA: serine/threonine-protein kinase [Candidatus Acidoferrum sp.]|nr:serine/threonine-protein kinase [Candidatus Acidoferrum sp.]